MKIIYDGIWYKAVDEKGTLQFIIEKGGWGWNLHQVRNGEEWDRELVDAFRTLREAKIWVMEG